MLVFIKAICYMGIVSSVICFINTYVTTYQLCFHRSPMAIFIYTLRPLAYFVVVGITGMLLTSVLPDMHLIASLVIKTLVWMIMTYIFLQLFTPFKPSIYFRRFLPKICKGKYN